MDSRAKNGFFDFALIYIGIDSFSPGALKNENYDQKL